MAGRTEPESTGFAAQAGKYAEALELIWFQYVVGYDKQEQRSLASSLQNRLSSYRRSLALVTFAIRNAVSSEPRVVAGIGVGLIGILLLLLIAKRIRHFGWRGSLKLRPTRTVAPISTVQFYERLIRLLSRRGMERDAHLTPLEFAGNLEFQPALVITRAYNRVRFGGEPLSQAELLEIDETLKELEGNE
jgi:hypothetical protein